MSDQIKYLLDESRMPKAWYNIAADLPVPLPPPLHPGTLQPLGPSDLAPIFPNAIIAQEMSTERYIDIPEPVRDVLVQALLDCCRDVITEAEQERVFLLEERRLARLADDIVDPALQKVALSAMLIIAKADGTVSEGEQTLLRYLMKHWGLALEDLAA